MKAQIKRTLPVGAALVALLLPAGCHHQTDDTGPVVHADGTPGPHMGSAPATSASTGGPSAGVPPPSGGSPAGGGYPNQAPAGYPVYRQTGGPMVSPGGSPSAGPSGAGAAYAPAGPSSGPAPGGAPNAGQGRAVRRSLPPPSTN